MGLQITDKGSYLQLTSDLDPTLDTSIYKAHIAAIRKYTPEDLLDNEDDRIIIATTGRMTVGAKNSYDFYYREITSPASTDIDDLIDQIREMSSSVSGTVNFFEIPDDAIQVTATTTAATLQALLEAENPALTSAALANINYIEINAEGDIRYQVDAEPTISAGMNLNTDETRILEGVNPDNLYLISEAGSVLVNVQLGTK